MIAAKTYNLQGEALKDTSLPKEVFGVEVKPVLLAQAVRVYLSNQRRSPAKTKTRGMVAKTTAKMYRQKGTGRARHGSYAAPIFVGGGIAHGPSGEQNYQLKMPVAMRRLAFLGALTSKAVKGEISVVTGADQATGKTKDVAGLFKKLDTKKKTLIITTKSLDKFNRATQNIDQLNIAQVQTVNTYQVLAHKNLIITPESLQELVKQYVA